MEKMFFIIGIISVIIIIIHLLFLIELNICEIIKNKINKEIICYSLERYTKIWFYIKNQFYLIPTISITKAYYIEIAICWLCFSIDIGYRIKEE